MFNCQTCCSHGCVWAKVTKYVLIVGGLNWLLVGIGMLMGNDGYNVVKMIFGSMPVVEAIVYVIVGLAAISKLFCCKCSKCAIPPSTQV
jgi:uncharacterized membrane protein YuzA (DUF378 family)